MGKSEVGGNCILLAKGAVFFKTTHIIIKEAPLPPLHLPTLAPINHWSNGSKRPVSHCASASGENSVLSSPTTYQRRPG